MTNKKDKVTITSSDIEVQISKEKLTPEIMVMIGKLLEKFEGPETLQTHATIDKTEGKSTEFELIQDRDISNEEFDMYAAKIPSTKEIFRYIKSKDEFRHSIRDIQAEFMGIVLVPRSEFPNQQNLYQRLYIRVHNAQKRILRQTNGEWKTKYITPEGEENRYKQWCFVENK